MTSSSAIELSAPRQIAIEDRGRNYLFTVSPITASQWLSYFEGIQSTSENVGGKRVDFFDSNSARIALVEKALIDASGYNFAGASVKEIEDWQKKIPVSHKLAIGSVLVAVGRSQATDNEAISLGSESICLDALWTAVEGRMVKFKGLTHRLSTPNGEQQRRYSRDASRSRIVGSGRNAKTVWMGVQPTLVQLYDELIQSVEGYAYAGAALTDRAAIIEHMDSYHKVAAAQQLFEMAEIELEEGRD
jgi:hypothetical protein